MPGNYSQNKLTKLRDLAAGLGVVASLAVEAIGEVAEVKADKMSAAAVTIPATGWTSDSTTGSTGYPFYYNLAVSGVTVTDRADVLIAPASLGTAAQCGLCPVTVTGAGYVRIRAVTVPSAAMSAEVQIMKGGY